jgi:hypothetical protein
MMVGAGLFAGRSRSGRVPAPTEIGIAAWRFFGQYVRQFALAYMLTHLADILAHLADMLPHLANMLAFS